jgi:hypothetical protein
VLQLLLIDVCDVVSECVHIEQAEKFAWPRWESIKTVRVFLVLTIDLCFAKSRHYNNILLLGLLQKYYKYKYNYKYNFIPWFDEVK